jgi:hypothetical protein
MEKLRPAICRHEWSRKLPTGNRCARPNKRLTRMVARLNSGTAPVLFTNDCVIHRSPCHDGDGLRLLRWRLAGFSRSAFLDPDASLHHKRRLRKLHVDRRALADLIPIRRVGSVGRGLKRALSAVRSGSAVTAIEIAHYFWGGALVTRCWPVCTSIYFWSFILRARKPPPPNSAGGRPTDPRCGCRQG